MGQVGPANASTFANDTGIGTIAISNPSNAQFLDSAYATAVLLLGQTTNFLKATNFNLSVPVDATITGVMVELNRAANLLSAVVDFSVRLVKSGSTTGDNKADGGTWPSTDTYFSYGADGDMWNVALTPADVNASDFGVAVSANALLAAIASINHVRLTVYYVGSNRPQVTGKRVIASKELNQTETVS